MCVCFSLILFLTTIFTLSLSLFLIFYFQSYSLFSLFLLNVVKAGPGSNVEVERYYYWKYRVLYCVAVAMILALLT